MEKKAQRAVRAMREVCRAALRATLWRPSRAQADPPPAAPAPTLRSRVRSLAKRLTVTTGFASPAPRKPDSPPPEPPVPPKKL